MCPPHDRSLPTVSPTGKGEESCREPLRHAPILATGTHTSAHSSEGPPPYLGPYAHAEGVTLCHLVQVQLRPGSRGGTGSQGGAAHTRALAEHIVLMAEGSLAMVRMAPAPAPGPSPISGIFCTPCPSVALPKCQEALA